MPHDTDAHERWRAYPNTVLSFAEPHALRIDLRQPVTDEHRRSLAAAGWANPFAVFTAENPSGEHTEDEPSAEAEAARERENRRRHERLRDTLRRRRLRMREVEGAAPDGSYTEHCLAVDTTLEDAVRMARELDQLALFWFDGTTFWLVPAEVGERPLSLPGAPSGG